jgi:transcriptional regulator GlxA family with amidase domain
MGARARNGTFEISRVLAMLRARDLDDLPSLDELAAMTAMSRSGFSRTFHATAGVSLRAYLQEMRLKRTAALLVASCRPLTEIAQDCGFYDLPHLDKAFRRRFGMTPNEFRRRHAARGAMRARAVQRSA